MLTALWHRLVDDRDEDLVPQLVSWAIALSTGAAWLAVVYLTPTAVTPVKPAVVEGTAPIHFIPGRPESPEDRGRDRKTAVGTRPSLGAPQIAVDIASAFAATPIGRKVVSDVSTLINRAEAVGALTSTILTGDKTTLATGSTRGTPGISRLGVDSAGVRGRIGAVAKSEKVQRAEVHMQTLAVVAAPAPSGGTIDPTVAGTFVRARAAQLQYCYDRTAGASGSDLAGVVTLRLVLGENGVVRDAEVVRRTWSGPAAAETEACLLEAARRWQVPSASAGATLTLPISFTRGR